MNCVQQVLAMAALVLQLCLFCCYPGVQGDKDASAVLSGSQPGVLTVSRQRRTPSAHGYEGALDALDNESSEELTEEEETDASSTEKRAPGWGKRAPGWGKRAPGWGKRSVDETEEADKRAPGWGKRAPGWGKRSVDDLVLEDLEEDKRAPGWGKRAPGWGKRAPGWGKRAPGWGKRAPGWGKRAPGWGKRSPVEANVCEVLRDELDFFIGKTVEAEARVQASCGSDLEPQ